MAQTAEPLISGGACPRCSRTVEAPLHSCHETRENYPVIDQQRVTRTIEFQVPGHYGTGAKYRSFEEAVAAAAAGIERFDYGSLAGPRHSRAFVDLRAAEDFLPVGTSAGIDAPLMRWEVFANEDRSDAVAVRVPEGQGGLSDEQFETVSRGLAAKGFVLIARAGSA